jgi:enolase
VAKAERVGHGVQDLDELAALFAHGHGLLGEVDATVAHRDVVAGEADDAVLAAACEVIAEAVRKAGYDLGRQVQICLDPATSECWNEAEKAG